MFCLTNIAIRMLTEKRNRTTAIAYTYTRTVVHLYFVCVRIEITFLMEFRET